LPIESLSDIVLDIGRRPQCWIQDSRIFLCDDELKVVQKAEMKEISTNLGRFGSDNRAGLNGQLHRFSAMRDREDNVMGITIRVGRNVHGNAAMLMDLLMNSDKSILILGEPGSGKTTIVREATRKLAEDKNVIVVDTSNEIAGDGTTPHSCIGLARRMMVPSLDEQSSVMVECVQNHAPHVMVIDEIGRPKEVQAARTVKQRGVRIIASAHGDLRRLLKNKDLVGLVGGIESVTIGDDMAKEEAERKRKLALKEDGKHHVFKVSKTKTQRGGEPTFEIIVEVTRGSRHDWKIVYDSAKAVDQILDGLQYQAHLRTRNPETGHMRMEVVDG
jgi:stage III sporulation protein SpoIIIAA